MKRIVEMVSVVLLISLLFGCGSSNKGKSICRLHAIETGRIKIGVKLK